MKQNKSLTISPSINRTISGKSTRDWVWHAPYTHRRNETCEVCIDLLKKDMTIKEIKNYSQQKRITKLFKKYIVQRPNGNCQVLFALTELDSLVDEIINLSTPTGGKRE